MKRLRENRKEQARKRKNFLPTLVFTLILWAILAGLIYFIEPDTSGAVPLFLALLFLAFLFTFSTLLANSRRGLLLALALIVFTVFRYFGIGNILNLLLIIGLILTVEIYFLRR